MEDLRQPPTKTEIVISQHVSPKKEFISPGVIEQSKIRGDSPHPYNKKLIKIGPNGQPVKSKIDKCHVGDVSEARILFICDLSDDE